MRTPRNLVGSLPLLAEFDPIQARIEEATKQNRSYSLSEKEKALCNKVLFERAVVSEHNTTCHFAACRAGDREQALLFLNAFAIEPYKSVMKNDHRKYFGEPVIINKAKEFEDEFNN